MKQKWLSHLPLLPHVSGSELGQHCSGNGLSPIWCQAITWTYAQLLLIRPLGTNFSGIGIKKENFLFTKMHLNMSSTKKTVILSRGRWVSKVFHVYINSSMIHIECKMQTWPVVWDNGCLHDILMYLLCKYCSCTRVSFHQYGFTFNPSMDKWPPTWEICDAITYPFSNFNGYTAEM